jgi:hypothetical protein
MMQFVLPFLINFGVNKAMGMSTGKALGLAGVQAFTRYLQDLVEVVLGAWLEQLLKVELKCH